MSGFFQKITILVVGYGISVDVVIRKIYLAYVYLGSKYGILPLVYLKNLIQFFFGDSHDKFPPGHQNHLSAVYG